MFASTPKHLLSRPRLMHALVALAAASLIVAAVVIQKVDGLEPCPLCILQRYAFTFVAALAALAAAPPGRGRGAGGQRGRHRRKGGDEGDSGARQNAQPRPAEPVHLTYRNP